MFNLVKRFLDSHEPNQVTLIRHGESTENEVYRCAELDIEKGANTSVLPELAEPSLTDFGRASSFRLGRVLGDKLAEFDIVFVSSMLRARQTWDEMMSGAGYSPGSFGPRVEVDSLLVEFDPCREQPEKVLDRYALFCKKWAEVISGKRILLITHGNFIRAVMAYYKGGLGRFEQLLSGDKKTRGERIWNCSLTVFKRNASSRLRLDSLGEELVEVERTYARQTKEHVDATKI